MRAWITSVRLDGSECVGSEWQWVTPEYKTLANMEKFCIHPKLMHCVKYRHAFRVKASVHNNWDTRYGKADHTYYYDYPDPEETKSYGLPPCRFIMRMEIK